MKTPQIKAMTGMTPLGLPEKTEELLPADETPFNLAGEGIDNSVTAEGEARVRALAESEAKKAQLTFGVLAQEMTPVVIGRIEKPISL